VLKVRHSRGHVGLEKVGDAAAAVGDCLIRVQSNRFVEILDRPLAIALYEVGAAAAAVGGRVLRVQTDRIIVILDRAVVFTLVEVGVPRSVYAEASFGFSRIASP
jgi:hypothetical protein